MAIPFRTAAFWAVYKLADRQPVMQQPADKVRRLSDRRRKLFGLPGAALLVGRCDPSVEVRDTAAVLDDGTRLPLRVYRPRAAEGALPVVVNFHGGGWVSGDPRQSEWWASSVAGQAGVVVISVAYRLAPEHRFPGPPEDCYAATVWVAEHADELGVDAARLAVMGDSAGGNLAAVVSMMARDRGGPAIALQVLIYPSVDLTQDFPSYHENAHAPILDIADHENVPTLYLRNDGDRADPYVSPLQGKHEELPRTLVQTAEHDILRDGGAAYAAALRAAGVPVRLTNYVEAVHGYISLPRVVPAARQALGEAVAEIKDAMQL